MQISEIQLVDADGGCELRASITGDAIEAPLTLWFRFPRAYRELLSPDRGDPFLAALLLPAMRLGEPLRIGAAVSPRLLRAIPQIQSIFRRWDRDLATIEVETAEQGEDSAAAPAPGVGLFFSFGLDSFYSLLRNMQDHPDDAQSITHLILIHGFDMRDTRKNGAVFPAVLENARRLEQETGKEILVVRTNIREIVRPFAHWSKLSHGACLAAVGLCLERLFGTISIAATYSYDYLPPWGSHPLLDPLWSTERLTFVHDGCEATRGGKMSVVAQSGIAMETLRVCHMDKADANPLDYNCGICDKCVRTMLSLHLAGALETCKTLPDLVSAEQLRPLRLSGDLGRATYEGVVRALGSSDLDVAIKTLLGARMEATLAKQQQRQSADAGQKVTASRAEADRLRAEVAALRDELAGLRDRVGEVAILREKLDRARRDLRRTRSSRLWRLAARYQRARARAIAAFKDGLGRLSAAVGRRRSAERARRKRVSRSP